MTDHRLNAESGSSKVAGSAASLNVAVSAETWQFFAFVFAALGSLALVLLDEIPCDWPRLFPRWGAKLVVFGVLAYMTLFNSTVKSLLIRVLPVIKTKERR